LIKLVMEWIIQSGGLIKIEENNMKKAELLYASIDQSGGYYRGTVRADSRSLMNVTYRLPSEELETKFVDEAKKAGFLGLKGHRSVGGIRASLYNAVSLEAVQKLVEFMQKFQKTNA